MGRDVNTLAAFVLTFNRPRALATALQALLEQSEPPERVLVVDNGTGPDAADVVRAAGDRRVTYESTGVNLGSAGGVAYGLRRLFDQGFDWLYCVDDDTPPLTTDTLERLRQLIARHSGEKLGAVASAGSWWDWNRGEHTRIPDEELVGDVSVDTIGGGSQLIVWRGVVEDIGTPLADLFFGFWDPLYCLRMQQAGYVLMVPGELHLEYRRLADRLQLEPRRALRPIDPVHAVWRRYYVSRNYIYRMRETFHRPDLARREAGKALARSVLSWSNGPRYGYRYSSLQVRGVIDGYRGRLGRTVLPVAKPT